MRTKVLVRLIVGLLALQALTTPASAQTGRCFEPLTKAPALRGVRLGMSGAEVLKTLQLNAPPRAGKTYLSFDAIKTSSYFKEKFGNDPILDAILKENSQPGVTKSTSPSFEAEIGETAMFLQGTPENSGFGKPLEGIFGGQINFYTDKVVSIRLLYKTDKFKGLSNKDAGEVFANMLGLSSNNWLSMSEFPLLVMDCNSFNVSVMRLDGEQESSTSMVTIGVTDSDTSEAMKREVEKYLIKLYEAARKKKLDQAGQGFKP